MDFIIGLTILLLVTIQLSDLVCAGIILAGEVWERSTNPNVTSS
jgi:hypothetical protein